MANDARAALMRLRDVVEGLETVEIGGTTFKALCGSDSVPKKILRAAIDRELAALPADEMSPPFEGDPKDCAFKPADEAAGASAGLVARIKPPTRMDPPVIEAFDMTPEQPDERDKTIAELRDELQVQCRAREVACDMAAAAGSTARQQKHRADQAEAILSAARKELALAKAEKAREAVDRAMVEKAKVGAVGYAMLAPSRSFPGLKTSHLTATEAQMLEFVRFVDGAQVTNNLEQALAAVCRHLLVKVSPESSGG